MFITGRRRRAAPLEGGAAGGGRTRDEIDRRFGAAIAGTRHLRVVREDVLGEGEGAWDADPRYPADAVNCIIWLQLLLSEIYGHGLGPEDKLAVMDRIRYFGGLPAYGLRKCHYLDLWLRLEPAPLVRIGLDSFGGRGRAFVEVDKRRFKAFHNYPCELYHEDLSAFDIEYLTAEGLQGSVGGLRPGYYIMFPVASRYYLNLYGAGCGPMGLVHSIVLKVCGARGQADDAAAPAGEALVYHASTASGAVMEVGLAEYLREMENVFSGYTLYRLDPDWDFRAPPAENEMMRRIRECEAALPRNQENRRL